jgi:transcription initiation factor TFIIIB Brf1 subunit/transcription initiation factor TFIIB
MAHVNCPRCGSAEYGYDLADDGTEHWSCLECGLGIGPDESRVYAALYAYACGYRD